MQWLLALDSHGRIECIASQEAGARERFGLSRAETEASAWAIAEEGDRYAATSAVVAALATALDMAWLRHVFAIRAIHAVADWLYHWVARHRNLFPGVEPYCQQHACPEA